MPVLAVAVIQILALVASAAELPPEPDLIRAARQGDLARVHAAIERGDDLNAIARNQFKFVSTPLLVAVQNGWVEVVQALLDAGADPNGPALIGEKVQVAATLQEISFRHVSAINLANVLNDVEMFELLMRAGGRPTPIGDLERENVAAQFEAGTPGDDAASELLISDLPARPAPGRREGRCRLAILASEGLAVAGDALFEKLDGDHSFELVERQEIQHVLNEHDLAKQWTADDANAVRAGHLLRADALVLLRLRTGGARPMVEARLVRTSPGVVLETLYALSPVPDLDAWTRMVERQVAEHANALLSPKAVAVSVVGLRSTASTAGARELVHSMNFLLPQRLARQPGIILVERSALDRLVEENALTGDGKTPFWTGGYLIDGTIEPGFSATDKIKLSLRIRSAANGGPPIEIDLEKERTDVAGLVAGAVRAIADVLAKGATPARPADAQAEAGDYLTQARWAVACSLATPAWDAAEAAWQLGLRTREAAFVRAAVATLVIDEAGKSKALSPEELLSVAEVALDSIKAARGAEPEPPPGWAEQAFAGISSVAKAIAGVKTAEARKRHAQLVARIRAKACALLAGDTEPLLAVGWPESYVDDFADGIDELRELVQLVLDAKLKSDRRARVRLSVWEMLVRGSGHLHRPEIWREIGEKLQKAEAVDDRWLGWRLTFAYYKLRGLDAEIARSGEGVLWTLWEMRHRLARSPQLYRSLVCSGHDEPDCDQFDSSGGSFRLKLFLALSEEAEELEPFRKLATQLFKDAGGFGPARRKLTPSEESEVCEAVAAYLARRARTHDPDPRLAQQWETWLPGSKLPENKPVPSLVFNQYWAAPKGHNFSDKLGWRTMVWAENRLWFYSEALESGEGADPEKYLGYVFAIDLPSLRAELVTSRPLRLRSDYARMAVTPRHLYVISDGDQFTIFDRKRKTWAIVPELLVSFPTQEDVALHVTDEAAYVVAQPPESFQGVAFVKINPDDQNVEMLASPRRQPALSPLDNIELRIVRTVPNSKGEIEMVAMGIEGFAQTGKLMRVAYDPAHNKWRVLKELTLASEKEIQREYSLYFGEPPPTFGFQSAGFVEEATKDDRGKALSWDMIVTKAGETPRKVPIDFVKTKLGYPAEHYFETPAGIVIPEAWGEGFWFMPRAEFETFVNEHWREFAVVKKRGDGK